MKTAKKILLVEDETEISTAVAFRLRRRGFDVTVADDGRKALEAAFQMIPDIVILDLFLPELSGEEVCKYIREHEDEKIQKIPIVMLTAKTMLVDKVVGKVLGADVYMTKPFEMDHLLSVIDQLLVGQKPAQGAEFYSP